MTVRRLAGKHNYVGLAADTKPTTGVPFGSTFLVLDEGVEYLYSGTQWYAQPDSGGWILARKTTTFTGLAGAGEIGSVALFTVSGNVEVSSYRERCSTLLLGAATLETGIATDTNLLAAQTADATAIDADEWNNADGTWVADKGADCLAGVEVAIDASIIMTVGAANITAGVIVSYIRWRPLSAGASLVAA